MKISPVIRTQRDQFLNSWSCFIRERKQSIVSKDIEFLRSSISLLFDFTISVDTKVINQKKIANVIPFNDHVSEFFKKEKNYIPLRVELGFTINDLVEELFLLRASLNEWLMLENKIGNIDTNSFLTFHSFIDRILSNAIEIYTELVRIKKQRFLAVINHDTRSPLFAISLGVRHLLALEGVPEKVLKVAKLIETSAEQAIKRMGDYYDYSLIKSGQSLVLIPVAVDMTVLCTEVIEEIHQLFPDICIVNKSTECIEGTWDYVRIRQAVYILLLNAIQSAIPGTRLEFSAILADRAVAISIIVFRTKIKDSIRRIIFDPEASNALPYAETVELKNIEKNRIGLWLAREIIRGHNGTLTIENVDDEDTHFEIKIPLHLKIS